MCFNEDWKYEFTRANNCLLELIEVDVGHLDELQQAEKKYLIRRSL